MLIEQLRGVIWAVLLRLAKYVPKLIALLASILLVPVVPYTMLLGTVSLVGGLLLAGIRSMARLGVWLLLSWLTEGVRLLAQVPWADIQLSPFPTVDAARILCHCCGRLTLNTVVESGGDSYGG